MQYAMTFEMDVYDFDAEKGESIITRTSDYVQSKLRFGKEIEKIEDETLKGLIGNYSTAFFALKRLGKLAEYGLSDDGDGLAPIYAMTERVSVYVTGQPEADSLPLRASVPSRE